MPNNAIQIIDGNKHAFIIQVPNNTTDKEIKELCDEFNQIGIKAAIFRENVSITAITRALPTIQLGDITTLCQRMGAGRPFDAPFFLD